jgi:iron(III) transport system substrate-binding protein
VTRLSPIARRSLATLLLGAAVAPRPAVAQSLVDAARRDGTVTWYSSLVEAQASRPMAAAFERKYRGIRVQLVSGTATDLLTKLLTENRAGSIRADVHHGGSSVWPLLRAGAVEPFVPESAAAYPPELRHPEGVWNGQLLYFLVPAVNTDTVREAQRPRRMDDLLDPRWRGRIAWTTQMTQGGAPGFIGTVLQDRGEEAGMAFLRRLAQQRIVNVPANQRVVLDQVIGGEYPIALSTFINHSDISRRDGAPVSALPLDPVTGTIDTLFLLKGPKRSAGKLFIEFVLSEEGQRVYRDAGYIPAHPRIDSANPALKPEGGNFRAVILTPDIVEANLQRWIAVYNELFR